ncbi:MAG: hypothetical protein QF632_00650 [Candidatus Woesearchaeota archaeon]|jgi:hypothetical protein|nr:hypothetical protein [Candidatus Woesearchaeota archaeon]MDP7323249.1 hypothetical protein [Candidatus Woesearchaeota archaeon]MDP7457619.1 hypothetical protein [Candidatus Woesearchaeota archaeon]|tara:strand:+ start:247 stop:936 length:690 start_codon:yes stop_codon:yes gene_type:complete
MILRRRNSISYGIPDSSGYSSDVNVFAQPHDSNRLNQYGSRPRDVFFGGGSSPMDMDSLVMSQMREVSGSVVNRFRRGITYLVSTALLISQFGCLGEGIAYDLKDRFGKSKSEQESSVETLGQEVSINYFNSRRRNLVDQAGAMRKANDKKEWLALNETITGYTEAGEDGKIEWLRAMDYKLNNRKGKRKTMNEWKHIESNKFAVSLKLARGLYLIEQKRAAELQDGPY